MTRLYEREIKDFFEVAKIRMAGTTKEAKGKFGKICHCFLHLFVYFPQWQLCAKLFFLSHVCPGLLLAFVHLSDSNVIQKSELSLLALMLFLMKKRTLLMSIALVLCWEDNLNC